MDLTDSVLLAVVDKLLIGILIIIFGHWINTRLERLKGQISLQNVAAPRRQEAYATLWAKTEILSPRGTLNLPDIMREQLFDELRNWYYKEGNAMYLSLNAADIFLKGLAVIDPSCEFKPELAQKTFSALRTQMKVDLGVYTPADARVQIPRA